MTRGDGTGDGRAFTSNPSTQIPLPPSAGETEARLASLGEVEALARKAARGAGQSWGLAEEAGRAARGLAALGLPGAARLLALLEAEGPAPPRAAASGLALEPAGEGPLCPLALGAALSDRADLVLAGRDAAAGPVAEPLLLLPALMAAARDLGGGFALTLDAVAVAVAPDRVTAQPVEALGGLSGCRRLRLSAADPGRGVEGATLVAMARPHPLPAEVWRRLDVFAARTYVPASAASRARGAGAGPEAD